MQIGEVKGSFAANETGGGEKGFTAIMFQTGPVAEVGFGDCRISISRENQKTREISWALEVSVPLGSALGGGFYSSFRRLRCLS